MKYVQILENARKFYNKDYSFSGEIVPMKNYLDELYQVILNVLNTLEKTENMPRGLSNKEAIMCVNGWYDTYLYKNTSAKKSKLTVENQTWEIKIIEKDDDNKVISKTNVGSIILKNGVYTVKLCEKWPRCSYTFDHLNLAKAYLKGIFAMLN